MSNDFEPKTARLEGWPEEMTETELIQAELYKAMVLDSLLYGIKAGQGYGKNYKAAEKIRAQARANFPVPITNSLDSRKMGVGILKAKPLTKLPPKICNYRKPKLYWFGELHGSNNLVHNPGYSGNARHWDVFANKLKLITSDYPAMSMMPYIKGADQSKGTSMHVGDTVEEYKGKRFIGISELTETEQIDNDFLKRFTGDDWVETRTLSKPHVWKPQGKIFVTSGKPLKINDKSKETIERVERIEYPGD